MKDKTLIEQLEYYRTAKGYTKTYLANLLGAPRLESYLTWVARNSLPKKYYEVAREILRQEGDLTSKERSVIAGLAKLSIEDQAMILKLMGSLLKKE